jgi:Inner membrane component of T3SS, cytoplasmic domain
MARSYLLSFMATRAAVLGAGFAAKYPGAWLVWEPGAWHAPESGGLSRKTLVGFKPMNTPSGTDALCFQLALDEGKTTVRVGRDEKSDVVVNDATVSREHLILNRTPHGLWEASPAKDRQVKKDGALLEALRPSPVTSGARLELGSVTMTFYDGPGFEKRVWGKAEKK